MDSNITRLSDGSYKVFVRHHKACNNLNKRLRQYTESGKLYEFQENEEGVFTFKDSDLLFVKATLNAFGVLGE